MYWKAEAPSRVSPTAPVTSSLLALSGAGEDCDTCGSRRPQCEIRSHSRLIHPEQSGYVCRDERACAVRQHIAYHLRPMVVVGGVPVEISPPVRHCDMCTAGTGIVLSDEVAWTARLRSMAV
jgi:hypothetical protein